MKHCPACSAILETDADARCGKCGISFAGNPPIEGEELAHQVRVGNRKANLWIFIVTGTVLAGVPCALFGASPARWALGFGLAAVSTTVIHFKVNSSALSMLLYAIPQIAFSGINFFAWLTYIIIGYALGLWKASVRDLQ